MIVCICNAITERDIDEAVKNGATSLEALQRVLPVANQCGSCHCCAEAYVEAVLARRLSNRDRTSAFQPSLTPVPASAS